MTPPELLHVAAEYVRLIRVGDRGRAVRAVLGCVDDGLRPDIVIQSVLAPAQEMVGLGWEKGRWSIAMEHRASAITEAALEAILMAAGVSVPDDGSPAVAVVCAEGEWHTLPARMAAAVMRLRGLDVTFVGPSLPAYEIAGFLGGEAPPVIAVSCALPYNLAAAWRSVTAARQVGAHVLAGGRGFGPHGVWSALVGADDWAPDFTTGADLATVRGSQPPPLPRPGVGDPAAVEEVMRVRRDSVLLGERVVRCVLDGESVVGPLADDLLVTLRDDVAAALGAVAASVLVGDPLVVLGHVEWLERVVAAREFPLTVVATMLAGWADVLPDDAERTQAMIAVALDACTQPLG